MTTYGYARVSRTLGQTVAPQIKRLKESGVTPAHIYCDEGESGSKASRPEFDKLLSVLQSGDTLTAVRLDRFGRSVSHLIKLATDLQERGIDLVCTDQAIDTRSPAGKLIFHILAAVAEFERDLTVERTLDGLAVARANGKVLGGKRVLTDEQVATAVRLRGKGERVADIAVMFAVSPATMYRELSRV